MDNNESLLREKLKNIWDDRDFINGTICLLENDLYISKMIDFLEIAKEQGDEITSDDVLALALVFDTERETLNGKE